MKPAPLALLAALAIPTTAAAQPVATGGPSAPPPAVYAQASSPEAKSSINVNPLALLFGAVSATFEHKLDGHHGLVVDVGLGAGGQGETTVDDDIARDRTLGFLGVGYRYHFRGRQHGTFVGVMLHQGVGEGEMVYADGRRYEMSTYSTSLTGNFGKRWMLGDRWNITARLGLGYSADLAVAESGSEAAEMAEQDWNEIKDVIPLAIDGELSVGYNF